MTKSDNLKDRLDELFSSMRPQEDGQTFPGQPSPTAKEEAATPASGPLAADSATMHAAGMANLPAFQTVFENLGAGVALTHLDGRFMRVNSAFCTLLGYAPDELEGRDFQAVTYESDLAVGAEALRAMLSGEKTSAQIEKRYVHKDGHLIWVQLNITLMRDAEGKPIHFVTIVQDVSRQYGMAALLEKRVRELNCLSDIGHRIDEKPPLDEFLQWVTERIPVAFHYPELCIAAIEVNGKVYGKAEALQMASKTVGGLRAGNELLGWLHIAYTEPRDFVDAESALVGSIVSRVSGYIESQRLSSQTQLSLQNARESQQLLRSVIDHIPNPIFFKDTAGVYTGCNQAFLEYLGQPAEAIIGKSVYDLNTNRELADRYHEMDMTLFRNPGLQSYEASVKYADGSLHQVIFNKATFNNPDGSLAGLVGTMVDITERKAAEQALAQERQLLRTLIDNIPGFVYVKDRRSRFLINNLAHLHACGLQTQEEAQGKWDFDFFPQEDAAKYYADEQRLMEAGESMIDYVESAVNQTTGQRVWLSTSKIPLRDERGEVIGLVGINHDITRERETEQYLARSAAELATVARVSTAVAIQLDPQELLQTVVDLTKENFDLYHAHVFLIDKDGKNLVFAAGTGDAGKAMASQVWGIPVDREQSLVARVARERRGVIVNDVQTDPGFLPNDLLPETRAELAVPLIAANELLGVLDVQSDRMDAFSEQDETILTTLGYQVAVALQNARLYERAQHALNDTEMLYEGSAKVASATDMQAVLNGLVDSTELKVMDRANILFFDRPWDEHHLPETMTVAAVWEHSGQPTNFPVGTVYPFNRFPAFQLLDREAPTIVPDINEEERADENLRALLKSAGMRSILCFPLRISGQWIGMVTGQSAQPSTLSVEQVRRTSSLMDQAATVAQNLRLIDQIQSALQEAQRSQQTLVQEQRLLRTIVDATPDWIFIKDQEYRYRLVNQGYSNSLHIPVEDFIGKNDLELGFPEELVKGDPEKGIRGFWADDRLVMDSGEAQIYPNDPATIDGKLHIFHTIKTPLHDETGKVWGVLAFSRDVTERENLLAEAGRQAQILAVLNDMSRALTTTLDTTEVLRYVYEYTSRLMDTSNFFVALYDEAQQQLNFPVAFSDGERVSIDPRPMLNGLTDYVIRSRQPLLLNHPTSINHIAEGLGIAVLTYADDLPALSWLGVPMLYGDQVVGVLAVQSVTTPDQYSERQRDMLLAIASQAASAFAIARQYQQAQQALAEANQSQRLMRTVIDATPDWIFIKDQEHRYRLANKGYSNSLHIPVEDFIGKNDLELGFPEELVKGDPEKGIRGFWADDRLVMDSGEAQIYPNDPATIDGKLHIFHTIKSPLRDDNDRVWGVLAFSRDITEREGLLSEVERQSRVLQILNEFGISLASALDIDSMAHLVHEYTGRLMEATSFYLALYDPATSEVSFPLMVLDGQRLGFESRPLGHHGFTDYILHNRKPVLLSDHVVEGKEALGIVTASIGDDKPSASWLGVPMLLGDQPIGVISVQSTTTPGLYTQRELDLLLAVANQAANAFAVVRQYQQTQAVLAATEALYAGSQAVTSATSANEVLTAMIDATALKRFDIASISLYNRPWITVMPETAVFMAVWDRSGKAPIFPLGMSVPMQNIPFVARLSRNAPTTIDDIAGDDRLDERARALFANVGNQAVIFPLPVGQQSIGTLTVVSRERVELSEEEMRQINSLVGQAAAVIQGLHLLEQANARLRREQSLREITTSVRASNNPDMILRNAVRQLGEALGRKAFIQLKNVEELSPLPAQDRDVTPGGILDTHSGNNGHNKPDGEGGK